MMSCKLKDIDETAADATPSMPALPAGKATAAGAHAIVLVEVEDRAEMKRRFGRERSEKVLDFLVENMSALRSAHSGREVRTGKHAMAASFGCTLRALEFAAALQQTIRAH